MDILRSFVFAVYFCLCLHEGKYVIIIISLLVKILLYLDVRRVWRYQGGSQNPYIEEEQTTQYITALETARKQKTIQATSSKSTSNVRIVLFFKQNSVYPI